MNLSHMAKERLRTLFLSAQSGILYPSPRCPFRRKGQFVTQYIEDRHSYIRTINGIPHYFAYYEGQSIEVEKPVFRIINSSYRRDLYLEECEKEHFELSLEQLREDMIEADRHGAVPAECQVCSAEDSYCKGTDHTKDLTLEQKVWDEITRLPEKEKKILLTFSAELDDDPVRSLAKELGMAVQSLYEQRKVIAKRVHNYVTNEDLLELFGYEDQRDLGEAILNYIATLPPDEKALLLVTRYGEKTADEIAKERGIARRTVFNEKKRLVKRIAKTVRKQAAK